MTAEQIASVEPALRELLKKFEKCFEDRRTRGHWLKYLVGLLADVPRKSIEPIALAAGVPVRTLQEFLSQHHWDHRRAEETMQRLVADEYASAGAIGVIDSCGHPKRGDQTPGVQRQWCGQIGKVDNCVVGQHLLYTDNDGRNPFSCLVASDLFLPQSWAANRSRCRAAGIPDEIGYRPKWQIAVEQVERAIGQGLRFAWLVFDEEYGRVPAFWLALDRLGQRTMGEVPPDFNVWTKPPAWRSMRPEHASKEVQQLARHSPAFCEQPWRTVAVKATTRGLVKLKVKAVRVQMVAEAHDHRRSASVPTDRRYWLLVTDNLATGERKYWVSNAPAETAWEELLKVALSRWQVEKWFERAKQEAGFGAFEVRTYRSLIRHWLSSRVAMLFLARETRRLRGEKCGDHAGAGGRRGQQRGLENLATVAERLERSDRELRVSSAA
jgi:SRSO17 transposase